MRNIGINRRSVVALLVAREVQALAGETYRRRNYDCFTAELVLAGGGWLEIDGRHYEVEEGDVYILPPSRDHIYAADATRPWRKLFFNMGGTLPTLLLNGYGLTTFHIPDWQEPELFKRMLRLYEHLDEQAHREAALLLHRLLALAAERGEDNAGYSSAVSLAINFIENNLQNRIRLVDIARASFLSPSQLTRLFKAETGRTPYDYLCRQRIEMAKHLLRCTDLRLADIAARLQFADAFYFSSAFRKSTGCSPRTFRRNATS